MKRKGFVCRVIYVRLKIKIHVIGQYIHTYAKKNLNLDVIIIFTPVTVSFSVLKSTEEDKGICPPHKLTF